MAAEPVTAERPRHTVGNGWRRSRWIAAGAGTLLAAMLGIALVVHLTSGTGCATAIGPDTLGIMPAAPANEMAALPMAPEALPMAPQALPMAPAARSGTATFYNETEGGNCSYPGTPPSGLWVALAPEEYANGAYCGEYLDVGGPKGTVRVMVVDSCATCETTHIDLSPTAFARIADPVQGIVPVTYRVVSNPKPAGPLKFKMADGAHQYWFALLVMNTGNALSKVEVRTGSSGWTSVTRSNDNYWQAANGLGGGPFTIRVTDVNGHQATVSGIRMAPGQIQTTSVWLYGGASPSPSKSSPSASASPSHAAVNAWISPAPGAGGTRAAAKHNC